MTTDTDPLLGALVRRLTHDLANPLAALSTMLELSGADALAIAAADELSARLAFARLVYGGEPDSALDQTEWRQLCERQIASHHAAATVGSADGAPSRALRAAAALATGLADRLSPRRVSVCADPLCIELDAPRRTPDAALAAALEGDCGHNPTLAPVAHAARLMGRIAMEQRPGGLAFAPTG